MGTSDQEVVGCGTVTGHNQHYDRNEKPCDRCKAAYRLYQQERARRIKACGVKGTGTRAGYLRHCREGDTKAWREGSLERCIPCTEANAKASRVIYRNKKNYADRRREYNVLYGRVTRRLAKMYPKDFQRLMAIEQRKWRKEHGFQEPTSGS